MIVKFGNLLISRFLVQSKKISKLNDSIKM